jgi:hypothetical protein
MLSMDNAQTNPQSSNYLSPHFGLSELTFSQWATRHGVDNTPDAAQLNNLKRLAHTLEGVRTALMGMPLIVSSGFRNEQVNDAIGGVDTSAHVDGLAVDFVAPDYGTPADIMQRLIGSPQGQAALCAPTGRVRAPLFDQLILEGRWVHLGLAPEGKRPRGQVLKATFKPNAKTIYTPWRVA